MNKLITLFLIGIAGIILFMVVKNMANGDGLLTVTCRSAKNTLTIKLDPKAENFISATTDDGEDFDLGNLDEKIQKDGLKKAVDDLKSKLELTKGYACFDKK